MRYRTLGRSGWRVSEIGFGAWQIGGDWGTVDDNASIDTLLYAFERGINFVDTAELYGNGHSEEAIGRARHEWKGGKIYVATKVRPIVWPSPQDDDAQMRGRFPEWYVRDNIEKSLKRLGVENDHVAADCRLEPVTGMASASQRQPDQKHTLFACEAGPF